MQKILKEIQVISNKIKQDEEDTKVSAKWKYAAMVMKETLKSVIIYNVQVPISGDGQTVLSSICSFYHDLVFSCFHISAP